MLHASKESWLKFVNDDIISEDVDPVIADAWKRCKEYGVNHMEGMGTGIDIEAYERAREENKELLAIARPIMENLHEIVTSSHFALVLSDRNGLLIEAIGDEIYNEKADRLRYNPGMLWSEEEIGANAIGTALAIDKPVHFIGEDHYCIEHHSWTCSAANIHDEDGNIIGCLDMSGDKNMSNTHTLGIVVAAIYTIEREMALKKSHKLLETTFESTSDGMVIVDKDMNVIRANNQASNILFVPHEKILEMDIRDIFTDLDYGRLPEKRNVFLTESTAIVDGRRINCSVNIVPIIIDKKIFGFNIAFKETKYLHRTVNKVAGNIATYHFEDIIGDSESVRKVAESAKKIAKTRSNVLIEGESGTGKELFAQSIHNYSPRSKGPFVAINCASLPRELIESELFGYEKGAFTGALKDGKIGKFELADGGTIFLDEIGELPMEVQAKLLRVLDNFSIRRIGSDYEKKLDVRVIAATNRDLLTEVENKNFRHDLYYRLNVFKLELPPLRERDDDISICANHFLLKLNTQNSNSVKIYGSDFLESLKRYRWVGNVRELQNIVERAYYLCDGNVITAEYLPDHIINNKEKMTHGAAIEIAGDGILDMESVEKRNIIATIKSCDKNVLKAAEQLSMSKSTIYRKIRKYGINVREL
ncbi:Transcriptional regulator of acetoin/glycerol metabolism [Dethiosulfatibacter aminovorans DSM 17477]|uniref:Transcriptional regulator of acetoin/glycerol metabolism n=1 Tax=Dethiosulfatibacter aminovorans DSM 17477 TaxID=1121476 RepID=A0A1M6AP02_9FIRM|nr:sigma-54-dependent Fis family transcriptional regulator [Dethiosulfatibacter aminovorans]SHI38192.1 Transcriptional regulator of acetoin/glycerol metabolism [Dethiosulfatibacter aminovorans DSM 17477]